MKTQLSRRKFLKTSAFATAAASLPDAAAPTRRIATGPFQPTWESFKKNYQFPEWYRDAKFGIWAHWTAQGVPEQGGNPALPNNASTAKPVIRSS